MQDKYWLTENSADVVAKMQTVQKNWTRADTNPAMRAWSRNAAAYYSTILRANYWETALGFTGEKGELVEMVMPMARNLTRQLVTIITKQSLDFSTIANVTGSDVRSVTRIGDALAKDQVKSEGLDKKAENMVELGIVQGCSYLKNTWRTDKGRAWEGNSAASEGNGAGGIVFQGETEISVLDVFSVYFDYTLQYWDEKLWAVARTKKNRWELIAQHPELRDSILSLPSIQQETGNRNFSYGMDFVDSDMVYVFELYCKPSAALPLGRMIFYSDPQTIYYNGPNRYKTIPIEQFMPEPIFGLGFGYPKFSDFLPAQEMLDHSFSAISSNQSAHAVQNILNPRTSAISVEEIAGMNFISYTPTALPGGGKPEALQLCKSSPETFEFIKLLHDYMEQQSNLNAALRGQPISGVTSGVAYATLTANALEFISSAAKAYADTTKKCVMHGINNYRQFGRKTQRYVRIQSFANAQETAQPFTGADLDPIQYVDIQMTNPLMLTIAGRLELAKELISNGIVKTMDEYLAILEGQPLKTLTKVVRSENDLIESENEALQKGEPVIAMSTDKHGAHFLSHKALLNDPSARFDQNRNQKILEHMMEHIRLVQETSPIVLAMAETGKIPEGMLMMQPGMPPPGADGGGMPPGGTPLEGGPPGVTKGASALGEATGQAQPPGQPAKKSAAPAHDMLGRT